MNNHVLELIEYIRLSYSPEEKAKINKEGKETIFFRKAGKSLCYIDTVNNESSVTVVIGASLNDKVQSLNISNEAKDLFTNAKQFHDGKWLFFNIKSKDDLEDIKELLRLKRKPDL